MGDLFQSTSQGPMRTSEANEGRDHHLPGLIAKLYGRKLVRPAGLTVEALFQELRGEQRPERRRAILSLLEAHGMAARERALTELENELKLKPGDVDTYYLRNVIYLLHRIARESNDGVEHELDLLTRASARGQNIYVIKEAIMPVGQIKTDAAVKLLILRLAEFEAKHADLRTQLEKLG